jgi:hypothetical protein
VNKISSRHFRRPARTNSTADIFGGPAIPIQQTSVDHFDWTEVQKEMYCTQKTNPKLPKFVHIWIRAHSSSSSNVPRRWFWMPYGIQSWHNLVWPCVVFHRRRGSMCLKTQSGRNAQTLLVLKIGGETYSAIGLGGVKVLVAIVYIWKFCVHI